jgi:hypothetical protein
MATVVGGVSYGLYSLGKVGILSTFDMRLVLTEYAALRLSTSRTANPREARPGQEVHRRAIRPRFLACGTTGQGHRGTQGRRAEAH